MSQHDYSEIHDALKVLIEPGATFELRLIHGHRKRIDAGYFDNIEAAATAVSSLEDTYAGIYYTPNPVTPDLIARSSNRISAWSPHPATHDPEIVRRRWLLIDVDPIRPAGISSTDAQLDASFKVAKSIANALELMYGWPRPVIAASGNGCHVMYRVDEPNNDAVRDAYALFLRCLNAVYCTDTGCEVDRTVFNAARIWRLTGTWARKGDSTPTRPHRKSYFVDCPDTLKCVPLSYVQEFNNRFGALVPNTLKTPAQGGASKSASEYPDDEKKWRHINDAAYARLQDWVPNMFPDARPYKQGYRVSSDSLGLSFEEDLTIHPKPMGIKYFGVADQGDQTEGRRTPISLVAEMFCLGGKELAASKLAQALNVPVSQFSVIEPQLGIDTSNPASVIQGLQATVKGRFDFGKVPSLSSLQAKPFKEQHWIIKDVLPTGNMLLAARPKMRKTFLALQLGIAMATGGKFLNWNVEQGDVLFLGLEDNERRLRSRIKLLTTFHLIPPNLDGFRYWCGGVDISPTGKQVIVDPDEYAKTYSMFPRGEAGVEALKGFLDMYPKTRMIVIDTYAHFREQSNNRDVYQRDYDQMMPITRLAAEREILVLTVHHEKKGLAGNASGDFMEDISGTSGITGAVDGVMSIKGKRGPSPESEARQLMLSGRDIPHDFCIDMAFDAERGGWLPAMKENLQEAIVNLIGDRILTEMDIRALMDGVPVHAIRSALSRLKLEGILKSGKEGYRKTNLP